MTGQAHVIRGDARRLPLPDESVDLIVTSPPYFGLRRYTDDGRSLANQIGAEATPGEYIDSLLACTREWMRVLKPTGSLFVNLGDVYSTSAQGPDTSSSTLEGRRPRREARSRSGPPRKSLMLLPHRYAIRCVDELELILRQDQVLSKPNAVPEPVGDRTRRSHEYWFHMVRRPGYYSAVDEIREPHARSWGDSPNGGHTYATRTAPGEKDNNLTACVPNSLGALPGSVWQIASEPLSTPEVSPLDDRPLPPHYAAFPTEPVRRIVRGWSPTGICVECGQPQRSVVNARRPGTGTLWPTRERARVDPQRWHDERTQRVVVGYVCGCDQPAAPLRSGVVLDPLGGTGTTALVAKALGRVGVSVDRSHDYGRLARWRTTDPGQIARAMRVAAPPRQINGQLGLLDEVQP